VTPLKPQLLKMHIVFIANKVMSETQLKTQKFVSKFGNWK